MDIVRWGIVGTGGIAEKAAHDLRLVDGAELRAVGSRTPEKAAAFAERFGVPTAHGSYRALIDDVDVDVIYVATPHPQHHDVALAAIEAGKALLVEKAFTATLEGTRQVVAAARARGVFVMEALWTRFIPAITAAKALADAGEIGELRAAQGDFLISFGYDPTHRLYNPELGGGSLLDLGVYPISLAHHFLGPIESVSCEVRLAPTGVDAGAAVALRHANGAVSTLASGSDGAGPQRFMVSGSKGWIDFESPINSPTAFTVHRDGRDPERFEYPLLGDGYAHEFVEVGERMRSGETESPVMPLDATVEVMDILQRCVNQAGYSLHEANMTL